MILLETVVADLRHGVRLFYRNPGFTLVALLALVLGIGVNTAVFTAYKAMVLRPLDAFNPGAMVNVALLHASGAAQSTFDYADYEQYRDSSRSFSGLIAFRMERLTISEAGEPISQRASTAGTALGRLGLLSPGIANAEFATTFVVSENYFKVLGVGGMHGRSFESIAIPDLVASPCVLISENYRQKRFGGDPALLGRTIRLNGAAVVVIGITPRNFIGTGVAVPDFWLPIHVAPLVHADENWLHRPDAFTVRLFGRLAPGVTVERAQAEMTMLAERVRALHDVRSEPGKPVRALVWTGSPFPLPLNMYPGPKLAILLIMAAAAMVLVVACANVGSLQLARSTSRLDEFHTRLSIGATRVRVIRQMLTESAVLGLAAAGLALLFTWALLRIGVTLVADALPAEYGTLVFDVTPDLVTFAHVLAISLAASILFGLTPALESSRAALAPSSRGTTSSARSRRIQDVFVAAQVALALVLLISGSMLIRGSINALRMDPGYDSRTLVSLDYDFQEASRYTIARKAVVVQRLRARLESLPGVAAVTSARPPGDSPFRTAARGVDSATAATAGPPSALHYSYVQPNYFETVGIPLVLGRAFDPKVGSDGQSVVLSESAARVLWPAQSPIGRSVRLGPLDERHHASGDLVADGPAFRVIGVVRDIRGIEFDGSASRHVYLALREDRLPAYPILIRTNGDTAPVIRQMDSLLASIDRDLLATSSPLQDIIRRSPPFIVSSLSAAVASTVGLIGFLLASMGIYGTVSHMVARRTREVGIRVALGAQRRDVVGLILRDSTRPVVAGLLAGIVLAIGASYVVRTVLYGMSTVDSISFAGVSILFLAIALLAAFAPARRAANVDPTVALRCE